MVDAIVIPLAYGALALLALCLAIASRQPALIETGAVLFLAWLLCNAVVITQGHRHAPLLIPTIDAVLSLCAAGIAAFHQNRAAAVVFGVFLAVEIVHVAAFQLHTQGTVTYFLALNLLFLLQLTVVGGASVASIIIQLAPAPRMGARLSRGSLLSRHRLGRS